MIESILIVGLGALLPFVYVWGKRAGFERHTCRYVPERADLPPAEYVTVGCRTCGADISCALDVRQGVRNGQPTVTASVDVTDLEHHQMTHAEQSRPNAA